MLTASKFEEFTALIAQTFGAKQANIGRSTTANDVDGWDSVSHAMLIMEIEAKYGFQFPDQEIFEFEDVGALFDRTVELLRKS
jgi:acyl carrier protein